MLEKHGIMTREIIAGSGIGLLVGLLLGLSVSEVVGSVLSGLAALLGAFFGLYERQKSGEEAKAYDSRSGPRAWRIAAFGFICAFAVIAGILIRTNNLLSISLEDRIAQWTQAGYPGEIAREIVAFQELGITPKKWNIADSAKTRAYSSALFSAKRQSSCDELDADRYANTEERLNAFIEESAQWKIVAEAAKKLREPDRNEMLEAIWQLVCE